MIVKFLMKLINLLLTVWFIFYNIGLLYLAFNLNGADKLLWSDMNYLGKICSIIFSLGLIMIWLGSIYHLLKQQSREGNFIWGVSLIFLSSIAAYLYYIFRVLPEVIVDLNGNKKPD